MIATNLLLAVCVGYVTLLFAIAFWVDRKARQGQLRWLGSPIIYTLSISVYCTSWTFYGAVGSAARNGLEFLTIYLGPTLVFVGWWWLLRKLVRIGRAHRITSIADMISSRYGKSPSLAVLVTVIAVLATTPYIALQLQSLTRSYQVISGAEDAARTAFLIAAGLAVFTILFGTRTLDANERHHGVVAAIAVEAIVKLVALLAVGIFVVYGSAGGFGDIFSDVPPEVIYGGAEIFDARWVALTFLAATAMICLPRQFHVTVVENIDERHLVTASWLFPLYLFGMCLFVMPIAIAGLKMMPADASPDLYVLTVPLAEGRQDLALLAFLGGFSSATSMVIVAAIAVSTMVSNHVIMPILLRSLSTVTEVTGDLRNLLLATRRIVIAAVLALGFLYYRLSSGSDALAEIGLIAFAGVAQFLPALLGGIYWRGATRVGAIAGLSAGFALWAWTLFLPNFGGGFLLGEAVLARGPWGIDALRPEGMLGLAGMDPLIHALIWSVGANTLIFLVVSTLTDAPPLERLQGAQFVEVFRSGVEGQASFAADSASAEDLFILAQRILGAEPARLLFDDMARAQGRNQGLPMPTEAVLARLERQLAGSVGAASAHAMVAQIAEQRTVSVSELIDIADEAQELIVTTRQLAEKSAELERAAHQLRTANERLRTLDAQKDDFLSQVSHELRTPMTSIRSFSEILSAEDGVGEADRQRFIGIIHAESQRLTRLLDEILDMSRLESGGNEMDLDAIDVAEAVRAACDSIAGMVHERGVDLTLDVPDLGLVRANPDRLQQVLINLLSNAIKYNDADPPTIQVAARTARSPAGRLVEVDVTDNGGGVSRDEATRVFEKFSRGRRSGRERGAGLGLPISRAIMRKMGGDLTAEFGPDGTGFFRVRLLPATAALVAE